MKLEQECKAYHEWDFPPNIVRDPLFPLSIVDEHIRTETDSLIRKRFYNEFNRINSARRLGTRLTTGELSRASPETRSRALAWCARILAPSDHSSEAKQYLLEAQRLADEPATKIAHAIILSLNHDRKEALRILAKLNTPESRTAALDIMIRSECAKDALRWLNKTELPSRGLSPDGMFLYWQLQFNAEAWDTLEEFPSKISQQDLTAFPVLNYSLAATHLLLTVPDECRASILGGVPVLVAYDFPLAETSEALDHRRYATQYFLQSANIAKDFGFQKAAIEAEKYALWLQLRDPNSSTLGRQRLESILDDLPSGFPFLDLALQFKMPLDLLMIDREIERQRVLHGGPTLETELTQLTLENERLDPGDFSDFISSQFDSLLTCFSENFLNLLRIQALVGANRPAEAREYLGRIQSKLPDDELSRIETTINASQDSAHYSSFVEQFEISQSLEDLQNLVIYLEHTEQWRVLYKYARTLFERVHTVSAAIHLAHALYNTGQLAELIDLVTRDNSMLSRSDELRLIYSWTLYRQGELNKARTHIKQLSPSFDHQSHRSLQVRLDIALGDWPSLHDFVARERSNMRRRSATELLDSAQLAVSIGFHDAMDLISTAAQKGADDPHALVSCHALATRLGRDNEEEVGQWLREATRLSGADGPVRTRSTTDFLAWSHQRAEHRAKIVHLQCLSDIPMSLAARLTNRSLTDVTIIQARINQRNRDVRFHQPVPAFSGKYGPRSLYEARTIGIDESAILTLAHLNILAPTIQMFEKVYLPSSIFEWLFQEQFNTPFHQPSRIKEAEVLNALLTNDSVSRLGEMGTDTDRSLAAEVGEDLAALITKASHAKMSATEQHVVVRSAPLYKQSVLLDQEADLSDYSNLIAGCKAVVSALSRNGKITDRQERLANEYLSQQEQPWSHEVEIEDDAVLYLDQLAITYLAQCNLLDQLAEAGFKLIISEAAAREADWLVKNREDRDYATNLIEKIRSTLRYALDSHLVEIGQCRYSTAADGHWMLYQPSMDLFPIAHRCQAVVSDDRFCNRHKELHIAGCKVPICSSLDLLDLLLEREKISERDRLDHRHILRDFGYAFVPISDVEIYSQLCKSPVDGERIFETAELKTLRKYVLFVRMTQWLQHPSENLWLDSLLVAIIGSLQRIWQDTSSDRHIELRSDWILDLADCCGWIHLSDENGRHRFTEADYATWVSALIRISDNLTDNRRGGYLDWIEERVLRPLEEYHSGVYRRVLRQQMDWTMNLIDSAAKGIVKDLNIEERVSEPIVVKAVLDRLPSTLREAMIRERDFVGRFSAGRFEIVRFEGTDLKIRGDLFFEGIREFFAGKTEVTVRTLDDSIYRLEHTAGDPLVPTLVGAIGRIRLDEFVMLSNNREIRMAKFESEVSKLCLPTEVSVEWRRVLSTRPLTDREYFQLAGEFRDTPVNYERRLSNVIRLNKLTIEDLVPRSKTHYQRLVGSFCGSEGLSEYMTESVSKLLDDLRVLDPEMGLWQGLLLSSHPSLVAQLSKRGLSREVLGSVLRNLVSLGDCFSRVGGIELGLRELSGVSAEHQDVARLIEVVQDDDVTSNSSEIRSFVNLFVLVDGELVQRGTLGSVRPFYRRLAALSHAALVQQTMNRVGVDLSRIWNTDISAQGTVHHVQSLVDMRVEPFSSPGLASPVLIRHYLLARIKIASQEAEGDNVASEGYYSVGSNGDDRQTLAWEELVNLRRGPLQGGLRHPSLPDGLRRDILRKLDTDGTAEEVYGLLINASLVYAPDSELARAATNAIRKSYTGFECMVSGGSLGNVLCGLAIVAARSRCSELAQELLGVVSRHRGNVQPRLEVGAACDIGLLAAACHEVFDVWMEFTGNWLTVVAFSAMRNDEPATMNNYLKSLLHLVPQLWRTCGRAEAAIESLH